MRLATRSAGIAARTAPRARRSRAPTTRAAKTAFAIAALALATFAAPRQARADVSSWLSGGGGYSLQHSDSQSKFDSAGAMTFAVGVGSSPHGSLVVGGLLRSTTHFSLGTDLSVAVRVASGGFARGQWGLALDVGPKWRAWGSGDYGRWPIHAMVLGGAPWGLQVGVGADLFKIAGDDGSATGVVAVLELDLLRLTVMRQGATDRWWENPSPAGGRLPTAAKAPFGAGLLW